MGGLMRLRPWEDLPRTNRLNTVSSSISETYNLDTRRSCQKSCQASKKCSRIYFKGESGCPHCRNITEDHCVACGKPWINGANAFRDEVDGKWNPNQERSGPGLWWHSVRY